MAVGHATRCLALLTQAGICAGKHSIAEYLVRHHQFLRLHLPRTPLSGQEEDEETARGLLPTITDEKGTRGLTFPDVEALLDFVTKRWRENWVLTDIDTSLGSETASTLDLLLRRPFFLMISVDAPISLRYDRFSARCALRSLSPPTISSFVRWSDQRLYSAQTNLASLIDHSHLRIFNPFATLDPFYAFLDSLNLVSSSRLRPTWDQYFMRLATLASTRSNCMKRRVGAVLVRNFRVISTGYNGTPRHLKNCNEGGCTRCNGGASGGSGLSTCLCLHAEENALLEAGRERIGLSGGILYCDTCPCLTCAVKIVQVGIEEVVYAHGYNMDQETARVLDEGQVKLRQFKPERSGLVGIGMDLDQNLGGDHGKALIKSNGISN